MASQFSSDGSYFAQLSTDGKLKIWETATSSFAQEFTPDFHLTAPCTCLHFVQPGAQANQNHTPRKKKRRESLDPSVPYVALGTSSGLLLLYSIGKADLDFKIDSETSQSVGCLSWIGGHILYSAIDQNIVSWSLDKRTIRSKWKGGNEKLTSILVVPGCNNRILTAARNIKLWDVDRREALKTFTGHSYEVSLLYYVNPRNDTDAYVISGSKGDRLLSVWNLNEQARDKNAVASFLMEDIPANFSILTANGVSSLAVVTRSGVVHYYQHTLNGSKCAKPLKPRTTIQVASDTGQDSSDALVAPIPILGVFLRDGLTITIGHGTELALRFENVALNEYEKVQCLIRKDPRVMVAPNDTKASKVRTPVADNNVRYLTPHTSSETTKRRNDGRQEVPMEQRLDNLTLNKLDSGSKVPKVDNVAQLLVQGLHSKDKTMLRSVLNRHDETIIKNTIKRLPMPVIIPFVHEVTTLLQGKTVSSQIGALWLKHLLQIHTGLLLSNLELPDLLGPVLGTIESRLSLLMPLNRLRGRLDLLVSQVTPAGAQSSGEADEGALLIYDDRELSDSDKEDMQIAPESESDNEWVEESSEGDVENDESDDEDDEVEMLDA